MHPATADAPVGRETPAAEEEGRGDGGEADGGGVEITVVDDGPGFDPIRVALRGAQSSIIDRLTAAGGTAAIDSRPGAGTEVRLWIP